MLLELYDFIYKANLTPPSKFKTMRDRYRVVIKDLSVLVKRNLADSCTDEVYMKLECIIDKIIE